MARFCPLFSGSNGNCTYISASDTAILVDAGRSCKQLLCALKERQIDPSSIQALLITHEHTDHISGLKVLVDKLKIPVYASQEVLAKLEWDNLLAPGTKTVPLEHDSKVEIGGLWVNSFDTPHDSAHSLGYRVETQDGQCMVIATDLGYVTDQVREKLTGCDLVMLESNYDAGMLSCSSYPYYLKRRISSSMGHLSNEDCSLELARLVKTGTTRFILGHLSQNNNLPQLAYQTAFASLCAQGMKENVDYILKIASRSGPSEMMIL
ncbi:MBL fold metallo-hydrolase [Youxingia wuxianensis]|uniref:MBL fold metallo-hydrolase n=1 Tax=Youxingia wuxianensis TaxID=2763678 RepID=A0A926IBZ5_9FIRM|nr:MBL fold metallo-hydrolase [Youxingia wuxianensis]MBC8584652.1 MBL fold metallo-hydrolase [Youxingia wuxianensis]